MTNFPEVKEVRARILSLQEGEEATQEDFDSSPDFQLRRAVDEAHPPTVIGEHWIDHLDSKGHLAKCKPNAFKYEDKWLPLYTKLVSPSRYMAWAHFSTLREIAP